MSLAAPTILAIAALFPGIAFVTSYYSRPFHRELTGLSALSELALFLFWAIAIDLTALHIFASLPLSEVAWWLVRAWTSPGDAASRMILEQTLLNTNLWEIGVQYGSLIVGAAILGDLARRAVWALRLDLRIPMLRMKAEWFYVLLGREVTRPRQVISEADILVDCPGPEGSRLYAGLIEKFSADKDGGIQDITLEFARRWRYDRLPDDSPLSSPSESRPGTWKRIPGDRLVLRGDQIHSINMRYSDVVLEPGASRFARLRSWLWDVATSFLTLER